MSPIDVGNYHNGQIHPKVCASGPPYREDLNAMARQHRQMEQIVKGFANRHRLAIMDLLADEPGCTLKDVSQRCKLGVKSASAHLTRMHASKLIDKKHRGRWVEHRLTARGRQVMRFLKKLK